MKRALIYDPYLDTLGGGERYCLTTAECLLKNGWEVEIPWRDGSIIERAEERLDLDLAGISVVGDRFLRTNTINKFILFKNYDLIFWLSDGSIPFLYGKRNFLHFQVPFIGACTKKLFNRIKLKFIDRVVCNSFFTKRFIDKEFGVDSVVLYPPVDVQKFKPGKKENIILAVGRFEETMQAKRQDILIKAFKKMMDEGLRGWRLVLIGGSLQREGENRFLTKLKRESKGYPVEFVVNAPFSTLQDYYGKAKIFWHAAGFGIDERKEPQKVEHFGITTVEAMAAGCVPVVINKGGLKEIVRRGVGERWKKPNELIEKTLRIIKNKDIWERYSLKAQQESLKFSKENFCQSLNRIINEE